MLLSSFYFLVVLVLCGMAVAECLHLGGARKPQRQRQRDRRLAQIRDLRMGLITPWLAGWFLFQGAFVLMFSVSGTARQVLPYLLYFGSATLLLPFLVYAGAYWTLASGVPPFPWVAELRRRELRPGGIRQRRWVEFLILAVVPVVFTAALFLTVSWSPDQQLRSGLQPEQHTSYSAMLLLVYLLVNAAVFEEVLFRHYLQNRLQVLMDAPAGRFSARSILTILLVTLLWGIGHGGMIDPAWLKYLQIGVYGIALGIAQLRLGLEACVTLHLLYNGTALAVGIWTGNPV